MPLVPFACLLLCWRLRRRCVPALGLFYAGLVQAKNILSVLAQCFSIACVASLLWFVRHRSVGILNVNRLLRGTDHDPYPDRLIAFATNECGDYFCFDRDTGRIVSIDPRLFRKSGFLPENCGENGDGRITTGLLQAR